jgi:hypothetical protein
LNENIASKKSQSNHFASLPSMAGALNWMRKKFDDSQSDLTD